MDKEIRCYTNRELSWLSFNERVLDANGNYPYREQDVPINSQEKFYAEAYAAAEESRL